MTALWRTLDDRRREVEAVEAVCALGAGMASERDVILAVEALVGRVMTVALGLRTLGAVEVWPGFWNVGVEWPDEDEAAEWRRSFKERNG